MSPASTSFIMPLMAPAASLATAPSPATWTMPSSSTEMFTPNWSCSALSGSPRRAPARGRRPPAVFLDGDVPAERVLQGVDGLAARADEHPDLLLRDAQHLDARGELGDLHARLGDGAEQDVQDLEPARLGLAEGLLQELGRDARDLHVHLKRRDAVPRTGDLEVHVAHVVLGAPNVRQGDGGLHRLVC